MSSTKSKSSLPVGHRIESARSGCFCFFRFSIRFLCVIDSARDSPIRTLTLVTTARQRNINLQREKKRERERIRNRIDFGIRFLLAQNIMCQIDGICHLGHDGHSPVLVPSVLVSNFMLRTLCHRLPELFLCISNEQQRLWATFEWYARKSILTEISSDFLMKWRTFSTSHRPHTMVSAAPTTHFNSL